MSYQDQHAIALNQRARGNVTRGVDRILSVPTTSVFRAIGQPIGASTITPIPWDSTEYDTDGMWNPANPTRLTARTQGVYAFEGWLMWPFDTTSYREMSLRRSDGAAFDHNFLGPNAITLTSQHVSAHINLSASQYVELVVFQATAGTLTAAVASVTDRTNGFQACLISL